MINASIIADRDYVIDHVSPRLFGSFVEHLGRAVYGGIYEPGHPSADPQGFRRDVLALVKELGVSLVRYPGGNFVSGYRWEDGVGPKDKRPRRRDLAWVSTESNRFGTDEFIDWCRLAETEPMLAVNLGTRGAPEAGDLFEYCNHPEGTHLSDLRRANGHPEPHNVRLWCLGNEMDGPWQMGAKSAEEYGSLARESTKLMVLPDFNRSGTNIPKIEFVACGSSARGMKTFGQWDQAVLEQCFDKVDYLSVHSYVSPNNQDPGAYLAFGDLTMGALIREVSAIADAVAAKRKSNKRIYLSYDEWNVWYGNENKAYKAWDEAPPLLEDVYTLADALCVGGMLIALLNNCDRVKIACLAQLVNVIGPIMTRTGGPAWRQTIFHPFAQVSSFARGTALKLIVDSPTYKAGDQQIPSLAAALIVNPGGSLTLFALNRNQEKQIALSVDLRAFAPVRLVDWQVLDGDLSLTNTEQNPDRVEPRPQAGGAVENNKIAVTLPRASWNVIRLAPVVR